LDVGERVREAGETLKKFCPPGAGAPPRTPPFSFPLLPPPPPTTLTISPLVGEREREGRAKPKREAERVARKLDEWAREGERGVASDGVSWGMVRSKGLMKRVLWVRSVGKGSRVRD
jgi:hypothetical protein